MECGYCGGRFFRHVTSKDGYAILKCRDCALVQADVPMDVEAFYNREDYFSRTSTGETFGTDFLECRTITDKIPLNERTFDLFNAFRAGVGEPGFRDKSVLEIGPGPNGGTMKYLTALSVVEGLEISKRAVDHLGGLGFTMYCGSIGEVRVDKQYDMILAYELVEHLRDPKKAFAAIYGLLKPGGMFMLSTGNVNSLRAHFFGKRWSYFLPPQHLFYFGGATITRHLETAGFKKKDIQVLKYSLWSKKQAIQLGFPNLRSSLFLRLVSNLTNGMTVYATK
ncbi:MAG TPA: class I SAM-dependent methyltransferase [Candidatus Aminicenantes bacterium]|nr:class I SAM-dependent methyltransferase [Candidatus Aminicenantes bacterium]HRY65756.1 class I SAM-dependent methyltransferase [Candidatus Aminicenantes bacterium]HRZ72670.1 class I SAM-dependent methyltransferase [Candidatus Aminicenantes bacterium]